MKLNFILLFTILTALQGVECRVVGESIDSAKTRIEKRNATQDTSIVDWRFQYENKDVGNPFAILPHRPIYLMPVYYSNSPNNKEARQIGFDHPLNAVEVKFQISFKLLVWKGVGGKKNVNFYIAYTQQNWWQVYNNIISSPFRETNYEPEAFFMIHTHKKFLGAKIRLVNFGIDHQSNGRNVPASRSWNRLFSQIVVDIHNRLILEIRPWWRIPQGAKKYPEDPTGDDNPDIYDYLGYGHIRGIWMLKKKNMITFLIRDNMQRHQRGALLLDWSFPMVRKIRGYVQFFTGYGESLIDYNHYTTRFGAGIELTNWL